MLRTLMIASLNSGCWTAAFALATVILVRLPRRPIRLS
jgi:hypothetical protein